MSGCCIDPEAVADKFDYILHYYLHLGLKRVHDRRSEAIRNLGLNTIAGVVIHMTNMRGRYRIFPANLAQTFDFGQEEDTYGEHVQCAPMSNKQIKEFRRDWSVKVPQEQQDEIELLARPKLEVRLHNEQNLVSSIKSLTSMDAIVLSSLAKGANISDYDIELLLVPRSMASNKAATSTSPQVETEPLASTMTMNELANHLKRAGFKSVELMYRYTDTTCEINVPYVCFYDPRNDLSCQVSFKQLHPLGIPLQKLIQAYVDLDGRVEGLVYAAQQILSEHGSCRRFLSNYAITLMVIAYLQDKNILPRLQHHQERPPSNQTPQGPQQQPGRPSVRPNTTSMSKHHRRAIVRQSRRRRNQGGSGTRRDGNTAFHVAEMVPVTTQDGSRTRQVDCHFDQAMAQNKMFGRGNISTMGDLLVGFLLYFGFGYNHAEDEEISIVRRGLSRRSNMTAANVGAENASESSTATKQSKPDASKHQQCASPSSASTNMGARDDTKADIPMSTEKSEQQAKHRWLCQGIIVRDPFVTDRNITHLCTGWKLATTLTCIRRAFLTLEDGDLELSSDGGESYFGESEDESMDYDSDEYDSDSDDSDDESDGYEDEDEGDGDDEGSTEDRKRRGWPLRRKQVSQQRQEPQRRQERIMASRLAEELWKDIIFMVITERKSGPEASDKE
ncbi:hypothetical protein BGX34_004242 [Mortierella sp. NVP85]|nr:hypothetical protein BGX34_004242 [Mortierella sp. NVP85]